MCPSSHQDLEPFRGANVGVLLHLYLAGAKITLPGDMAILETFIRRGWRDEGVAAVKQFTALPVTKKTAAELGSSAGEQSEPLRLSEKARFAKTLSKHASGTTGATCVRSQRDLLGLSHEADYRAAFLRYQIRQCLPALMPRAGKRGQSLRS